MKELKIKFVNLQPLTPLKGINLDVDESSVILDRTDFAKWDLAHISIKPSNMSVAEYYRELLKLYEKIVFNPVHILSYMKYPLHMQLRMIIGSLRVHWQYRNRIMEVQ